MKSVRYSKDCTATQYVDSIAFEISLWEKVKLVDENGKKVFLNAEFTDDMLFPVIKVGGYNKANCCEEEFSIPCYYLDDMSRSEWREEYEESGSSPAYSYPEIEEAIYVHLVNLRADLEEAKERRSAEGESEKENKEDNATYYILGKSLVGKRDEENNDYLFMNAKWIPDEEGLINKLLEREDLTQHKFINFIPEVIEMINSIDEYPRQQAMEKITDQAINHLIMEWEERFAKEKEDWDKAPKWYSKLVRIDIMMNGIKRSIYPKDFNFKSGSCDDAFIEYISKDIKQDLRDHGAFVIGMDGMMN